jgi:hypothetical protein
LEPQNKTQKIYKQYTTNKYTNYEIFYLIHKQKKYTKIGILILMGRLTNLIFNLQFQIPSLLQSALKFSISDFAFYKRILYESAGKNYLIS